MQVSEELHCAPCEKGKKCVSMSVGSAQTLLNDVGGNRNLAGNKIFQRANLPKANHFGHKQISLRDNVLCRVSGKSLGRPSWAMGTVQPQKGACSATSSE